MSDSWIAGNLESTLEMWNEKLAELWQLLTQSPATFKGGAIWNVMVNIHGALQALAYALMVLFFVVGVMKTCGSFADLKRPEHAVKLFVRFAITKMVITGGLELMLAILSIIQGVVASILNAGGIGGAQATVLPQEVITACEDTGGHNGLRRHRLLGIHPPVGRYADRLAVCVGAGIRDDPYGVWTIF